MTPVCECHGEPMYRNPDRRYKKGGFWVCRINKRESMRRRYAESPEVRLDRQLRNLSRSRVSY